MPSCTSLHHHSSFRKHLQFADTSNLEGLQAYGSNYLCPFRILQTVLPYACNVASGMVCMSTSTHGLRSTDSQWVIGNQATSNSEVGVSITYCKGTSRAIVQTVSPALKHICSHMTDNKQLRNECLSFFGWIQMSGTFVKSRAFYATTISCTNI
jgi:hypothetical protein